MVLYSVLDDSLYFHNKQHLVIITNEITDEILNDIDSTKVLHIIFQVPDQSKKFDFRVSLSVWEKFASYLISLEFHGTLVDKQFKTDHIKNMSKLQHLVIKKLLYPLFDAEDTSNLPMVLFVNLCNNYRESPNLEKWLEKLTLNGNYVYGYKTYPHFCDSLSKYPLKPKFIDIDISGISKTLPGLIKIIKDNVFQENVTYNIDLKGLHSIKDELSEINDMVGMHDLKSQIVDQLLYFLQGLHKNQDDDYKHTVIYGCSGTGKSEISQLIGMMYSKIGVLKNNIFKKVTRCDLIGGCLGQTAIKTNKVIESCLGGVLFIDEVYSLGSKSDNDCYSKECIDTLCEALSFHKSNLMVIIAGYEKDIDECFFSVNKGLQSRFIWRLNMKEYDANELMQIFAKKIEKNKWSCDIDLITEKWFEDRKTLFRYFGRDMELLFTYTKICHGKRIFGEKNKCQKMITMEDLENGFIVFQKNMKVLPV